MTFPGRHPSFLSTVLLVLLVFGLSSSAHAVQPGEVLPDKAMEARARKISTEIRCLVCQNQSIDDSDAPLAQDLRVLVRERLKAGDDDAKVRDFIVSRYGDFVLLRPPVKSQTLLLWFGPPLVLLGAALGLFVARRRGAAVPPAALSVEEEARLAAILAGNDAKGATPRS